MEKYEKEGNLENFSDAFDGITYDVSIDVKPNETTIKSVSINKKIKKTTALTIMNTKRLDNHLRPGGNAKVSGPGGN